MFPIAFPMAFPITRAASLWTAASANRAYRCVVVIDA